MRNLGSSLPSIDDMAQTWSFLSHHGMVMLAVARRPDLRLREIAEIVGITPRATQTIVSELAEAGFIVRSRVGRRNHYQVRGDRALPDPGAADYEVSDLVGALVSGPGIGRRRPGGRYALVLGCSDHSFQEPLRNMLAAEGLIDRVETLLWPGGAAALTGPEGKLLIEVMAGSAGAERPDRVLLIAHDGCRAWSAFDRQNDERFASVREMRQRRARTAAAVESALGVSPETWYITATSAHRVGAPHVHHPRPLRLAGAEAANQ